MLVAESTQSPHEAFVERFDAAFALHAFDDDGAGVFALLFDRLHVRVDGDDFGHKGTEEAVEGLLPRRGEGEERPAVEAAVEGNNFLPPLAVLIERVLAGSL